MGRPKGTIISEHSRRLISAALKGRKRGPPSELHRKRLSEKKLGKRLVDVNSFKGDAASYRAVHAWIVRTFGKPTKCEECKRDGLSGQQIHWASTGNWRDRKREAWRRLCAKCHGEYDTINGLRRNTNVYKSRNGLRESN